MGVPAEPQAFVAHITALMEEVQVGGALTVMGARGQGGLGWQCTDEGGGVRGRLVPQGTHWLLLRPHSMRVQRRTAHGTAQAGLLGDATAFREANTVDVTSYEGLKQAVAEGALVAQVALLPRKLWDCGGEAWVGAWAWVVG